MSQLGRISGGVLKDNLLRNGSNLNFKNTSASTPILHLDVNNNKIGVNIDAATDALTLPSTLQTQTLLSTISNIANFTVDQSRIVALGGDSLITLSSTTAIAATAVATANLKVDFNTISTTTTDTNIEIRPHGTGAINIQSNWNVTGDLNATGNIQTSGNLTLGNDDEDNVTFASDVQSNIIPDQTNTTLQSESGPIHAIDPGIM